MKRLNLGCGSRFHPAWTNIDFAPADPSVLSHDLRKGIPFADEEFDLLYHSHVLEHFSRPDARAFLRECWRVLNHGGVIRVAVPDLEAIAKLYLQALGEAVEGDQDGLQNYEWMMLELYDQTVRERAGGEMADYFRRQIIPNEKFVIDRLGLEAQGLIESARQGLNKNRAEPANQYASSVLRQLMRAPARLRELIVRLTLGAEYELLQLGRFRRGGEIHLWMYDRYSLSAILRQADFQDPQLVAPTESRIPDWAGYNLDTEPDGTVYKPDSLFMEAFK